MKTYLDLYRAIRGGMKDPVDLGIYLERDADGVEVAVQALRTAKIAQSVQVLLGGGRYFEILPEAREEADALRLAVAAGVNLNATV